MASKSKKKEFNGQPIDQVHPDSRSLLSTEYLFIQEILKKILQQKLFGKFNYDYTIIQPKQTEKLQPKILAIISEVLSFEQLHFEGSDDTMKWQLVYKGSTICVDIYLLPLQLKHKFYSTGILILGSEMRSQFIICEKKLSDRREYTEVEDQIATALSQILKAQQSERAIQNSKVSIHGEEHRIPALKIKQLYQYMLTAYQNLYRQQLLQEIFYINQEEEKNEGKQ